MSHDASELRRFLSSEFAGALLADGRPHPVRFVRSARSGRLVMPVEHDVLDAGELVLFVPEEGVEATQLLLDGRRGDESDSAAIMRWSAYHADAQFAYWLSAAVSSAKHHDEVFDESEIDLANPLARDEPALVRRANADLQVLASACADATGRVPEHALAVGADDLGIDIRLRFGVVRLWFAERAGDADAARPLIDALLGQAR